MATLKDCIYGQAVGDALGVPFEFKRRGTFECRGMNGFGTHFQPAGTWSDDTSMALAICDSYKHADEVDIDDIRSRFIDWFKTGCILSTLFRQSLQQVFDTFCINVILPA